MEAEETPSFATDPWYIVHCKPRREIYTANILHNQLELKTYVPEIEIRFRKDIRRIPFFPGYFFIQANLLKVGLSSINFCSGVLKLLDFGTGPLEVPQELIEIVQEEVNRRSNSSGLSYQKFSPGDSVRVIGGSLEGLEATFIKTTTSGERVYVLLHLLGRLSKVQLDMAFLEKLDSDERLCLVSAERKRLTRGRGRKINRTDTTSSTKYIPWT